MEQMRIQKYLSACGVASRRAAEKMVEEGRVLINGKPAGTGAPVDPNYDRVTVDGRPVKLPKKKLYLMLYKPDGYVTTASDDLGRPTVMDLIQRDLTERVYPVGRLDYHTEGLLLLTNDGDFANRITHPSHRITKTYLALVKGGVKEKTLKTLRKGVLLEDGMTKPASARIDTIYDNATTLLELIISEGRNRQVRRMLEAVGHPVIGLCRTEVGGVRLGNLPYGKWRHLKPGEIERLKK